MVVYITETLNRLQFIDTPAQPQLDYDTPCAAVGSVSLTSRALQPWELPRGIRELSGGLPELPKGPERFREEFRILSAFVVVAPWEVPGRSREENQESTNNAPSMDTIMRICFILSALFVLSWFGMIPGGFREVPVMLPGGANTLKRMRQ